MLSAVLKSKTAIEVSIQIIDSFVEMRKFFATHNDLVMKIQQVEQKQILHEAKTQEKFEAIFSALEGVLCRKVRNFPQTPYNPLPV